MKKLILLGVLALAGCGVVQAQDLKRAKEEVASRTRDPSSVQFRDVRFESQVNGSKAVCGEMNAKNGYGGYVGFKNFAFKDGVLYLAETAEDIQAHTKYCVMGGRTKEQFYADHADFMDRMNDH